MLAKSRKFKPNLLHWRLVQDHHRSCKLKKGSCGLCRWHGLKKGLNMSWAHVCVKNKRAYVGCAKCALQELHGPWASFKQKPLGMRLHHFKRHEMSKAHKMACESQRTADSSIFAPSKEIFQEAFQRMRSGGSARDGGIASDKKQQVRWCLAEAAMDIGRDVLQHARCIAITRDERKGRLLVRGEPALTTCLRPPESLALEVQKALLTIWQIGSDR